MATATRKAEQTSQDNASAEAPDRTSPGSGRRPLCKADIGNGQRCEKYQGHEGEHDSLTITEADLASEFLSDEEAQEFLVRERSAEQVAVDEALARNYAEWMRRGSDTAKPVWSKFVVQASKAEKMNRLLRNAADGHNPPIQVKTRDKFVAGGNVQIAYAGLTRRKYEKKNG